MKKIYICSPYRGNVKKNVALAKRACRMVTLCGDIPVCPHIYFTTFLSNDDPSERKLGMHAGIELMKECDEVVVVGNSISVGMACEIGIAGTMGKKVTAVPDPAQLSDAFDDGKETE